MENSFNSAFLALKIWIYPNYCISLHSMMKTINTKKVIVILQSIPFLTLGITFLSTTLHYTTSDVYEYQPMMVSEPLEDPVP